MQKAKRKLSIEIFQILSTGIMKIPISEIVFSKNLVKIDF